jgi:opacity protein-like surface antigen
MRTISVAAVAALFLAAAPALAQVDTNDNRRGFYIGAGLGDFSASIDNPQGAEIDLDSDDTAMKLFGGWRLSRFFAVQLDYVDFGQSSDTSNLLDLSSDTTGLAPNIVGTLPIGFFELFAKAGMIWYDVDLDVDNDPTLSDSGEDPIYGVGVGLTLVERLTLRLEYEIIDVESFDDADAVWLTAAWRF